MKEKLLIVESPTKARTLRRYLREFEVEATLGHVKDLPKNELGVDIKHNFKPSYTIIPGKEKVVARLKKMAQRVKEIYLGPDPDREGEAIAWHVAQELNGKRDIKRVLFHEITPRAVREAIKSPTKLDENKFNSQQARRILDRLVGYKISPLLWEKVRQGLSAGRVQSVALRLICERERAIQKFCPKEYWEIIVRLLGQEPPVFEAKLAKINGKKIDIPTGEEAKRIVDALKKRQFLVSKITLDEKRRYPPPPFTTSLLQQEAAKKLKFTAQKTMLIAQQLYEGIPLGKEGNIGLITYMRTDSVRVSRLAIDEARRFINAHFGEGYLPDAPNIYKNKKHVQDAHEAIRPTSVYRTPDSVAPYLNRSQYALYELIWKRFVASQMGPAIYEQTTIDISAGEYLFQAKGSVLRWPGFKHLYKEEKEKETSLPKLREAEVLSLKEVVPEQHFTKPPPRYTEATLIKELEEKGIGRPSTYAVIISTILERKYVVREKGQFRPTELGFLVTDLLVKNFPDIMDVSFTAHMEEELDEIEEGKVKWVETLKKFYKVFEKNLKKAQENMTSIKSTGLPTDIVCEKCGHPMVIKWGKNGDFLACSNYPNCNNIKEFTRDEKGNIIVLGETKETCPECGSPLVLRRGRYGLFLACSGYPNCHFTKKIEEKTEDQLGNCPLCGQHLVIKRNKKGIRFIACSNYPNCKYTSPLKKG